MCLLVVVLVTPRPTQPAPSSPAPVLRVSAPDRLAGLKRQDRAEDVARWIAAAAGPPVVVEAPKPASSPRVRGEGTEAAQAPQEAAYEAGSIEQMIVDMFGENAPRALREFRCESGLDPYARNKSGASGIAQIMLPMHADLFAAHGWDWQDSWMVPERNLTVAFDLSAGGTNFRAWVCK